MHPTIVEYDAQSKLQKKGVLVFENQPKANKRKTSSEHLRDDS